MKNKIRKIFSSVLILSFILSSPSGVFAAESSGLLHNEDIRLYVGETKSLEVSTPSRIIIGNPKVVDVISATDNIITLTPKAPGRTTFAYWDIYGEHSYIIKVLPENIDDIKLRIDRIMDDLNITTVISKINEDEGKVFLMGEVQGQKDKERLDLALGALRSRVIDLVKAREEGVVEIGVRVMELSRDASQTLGLTWPSQLATTEATMAGPVPFKDVFKILNWTRNSFTITLDALASEGKAKILSQPRLSCSSGKEAELLVGGEKPIMTTSVQATGVSSTDVSYKEYGIKLKIKPTITEKDRINIGLKVEITETGDVVVLGSASAPTAKAYPLSKRSVSTELTLNDGQTLAIGGLIKKKEEETVTKVPILGDIPLIGLLFRSKQTKKGGGDQLGDTELFITLTPKIVYEAEAGKPQTIQPVPAVTAIPAKSQETKELFSLKKSDTPKKEKIKKAKTKLASKAEPVPALPAPDVNQTATEAAFDTAKPKTLTISATGVVPENFKDYVSSVQDQVLGSVYYPKEAKLVGWEGLVVVNLNIASDGSLKDAKVTKSSDYITLDKAALDAVRKAAPYKAFPEAVNLDEAQIEIPISYRK